MGFFEKRFEIGLKLSGDINIDLSNEAMLAEFRGFCAGEYSTENIEFLCALKELYKNDREPTLEELKKIYEEYIKPGSPQQINIPGEQLQAVQKILGQDKPEPTDLRIPFQTIAEGLFSLMEKDTGPRFIKTTGFFNCLIAERKKLIESIKEIKEDDLEKVIEINSKLLKNENNILYFEKEKNKMDSFRAYQEESGEQEIMKKFEPMLFKAFIKKREALIAKKLAAPNAEERSKIEGELKLNEENVRNRFDKGDKSSNADKEKIRVFSEMKRQETVAENDKLQRMRGDKVTLPAFDKLINQRNKLIAALLPDPKKPDIVQEPKKIQTTIQALQDNQKAIANNIASDPDKDKAAEKQNIFNAIPTVEMVRPSQSKKRLSKTTLKKPVSRSSQSESPAPETQPTPPPARSSQSTLEETKSAEKRTSQSQQPTLDQLVQYRHVLLQLYKKEENPDRLQTITDQLKENEKALRNNTSAFKTPFLKKWFGEKEFELPDREIKEFTEGYAGRVSLHAKITNPNTPYSERLSCVAAYEKNIQALDAANAKTPPKKPSIGKPTIGELPHDLDLVSHDLGPVKEPVTYLAYLKKENKNPKNSSRTSAQLQSEIQKINPPDTNVEQAKRLSSLSQPTPSTEELSENRQSQSGKRTSTNESTLLFKQPTLKTKGAFATLKNLVKRPPKEEEPPKPRNSTSNGP